MKEFIYLVYQINEILKNIIYLLEYKNNEN